MNGIPVLMYHALETDGFPAGSSDAGEQCYVLQVEQFNKQMAYLEREGFRTFLISELQSLKQWPEKAVLLTFDDGHSSNLTLSLPVLLNYGFKAEFFITTGWLGTPRYLKNEEVKVLHDAGMGIGSHGSSHAFLEHLDGMELEKELRDSRDVLARLTGADIFSLSAPGGRVGADLAATAKKLGYRFVFTSRPGIFRAGGPAFFVPRLALQSCTDLVQFASMVHGDSNYLNKLIRRHHILGLTKKMLGEKGYQLLRKMVLEI